ncbi:hypothetical protein UlMin_002333 [Ulmus minor]
MKGTKHFAVSDSNSDTNDSPFRNKRIMGGSLFDNHRAEVSLQQSTATPSLDLQRAELSRQHVRALNTQFASWVQTQLKNHPDELWEDGVRDYLSHASNIMAKFTDVVNWLKANAAKEGSLPAVVSHAAEKKMMPETKNKETRVFQAQSGLPPISTTTSFATAWSNVVSNNQTSTGIVANSQSSGILPKAQSSGLFFNSQSTGSFSSSPSFGIFSNSQSSEISTNNQSFGLLSNSQSSGLSTNNQSFGLLSNSQSSGLFSNSKSSGSFSNNQTPLFFGNQSPASTNRNTSDDVDGENEVEPPGSPSVKKSEEKGIVVVHETKCKLYVKSNDPADTDPWKDKGTGQLSIKCKEGVSKGTKESKPTIIVRNDVGRLLLNALLYPGIKTNSQKNSIVAIFHTAGDGDGNDGNVVARTFLIRLKTEDDRNKLATAIQEYAPSS